MGQMDSISLEAQWCSKIRL